MVRAKTRARPRLCDKEPGIVCLTLRRVRPREPSAVSTLCFSASKGCSLHEVSGTNVWFSIFVVALARHHLKLNTGAAAEGTFPKREYFNVAVSRELPSFWEEAFLRCRCLAPSESSSTSNDLPLGLNHCQSKLTPGIPGAVLSVRWQVVR